MISKGRCGAGRALLGATAYLLPGSPAAYTCDRGGIGRRAALRWLFSKGSGGSIPLGRTIAVCRKAWRSHDEHCRQRRGRARSIKYRRHGFAAALFPCRGAVPSTRSAAATHHIGSTLHCP